MQETLKMMKSILTGEEGKVDEKELIKEYQEKLSPNILAYFYSDNYGLFCKINTLYPIINEEDKASFCLQELDKCLLEYNFSTKFMTYFCKCYKNRLRMETEKLMTYKRRINITISNIDNSNLIEESNIIENEELLLNQYNLNNKEKEQCKLLNAGYTITEISNILKVKPITLYKRLEKIKQKVLTSNIILT